jgi:hypothetical protein
MKLQISPLTANVLTLLRHAGYAFQRTEGNEQAWVRVLASAGYPRFHMYTKQEKLTLFINLHLDHKKHTYGEDTRHHADYEYAGVLKDEVDRLLTLWGENASIGD